jgi:hypothetical protein
MKDSMAASDPFDELGVIPGASRTQIEQSYRSRVVERHRRGVLGIVARLRRAQWALRALVDPAEHERHRREREQRGRVATEDHHTRQGRQLDVLRGYKQRMADELERSGAENAARHAAALAEIERDIAADEAREMERRRRERLLARAATLVLIVTVGVAFALFWLRGEP